MPNISQALRITSNLQVAFVGAGGKTSAIFNSAQELAPVLVTTSTHLGAWQTNTADRHLIWEDEDLIPLINPHLKSGVTLVTGKLDQKSQRYCGLSQPQLEELAQLATEHNLPLLIEADGARQKALKAPGENEPVIPDFVNMVVVVAGLSGLGKPVGEEGVHRFEKFCTLSGLNKGDPITTKAMAKVLTDPMGGLKNIPFQARRVALLNQADTSELQARANELGEMLLPTFDSVIITKLDPQPGLVMAVKENIGAVVLAAGKSSRYGLPKQLLDFHGKPFIRAVSETALKAGLSPVIVVTGSNGKDVAAAIDDLPLVVINNPDWENGQSASVKAGLLLLPSQIGGAIFLLADQPQVSEELLRALVEHHSQNLAPIIAPYVFDQRTNPLLFDRITFSEMLSITGDTGGRAIFSKFSPRYLNWYDRRLLLDVDTPEDYQKLLSM